MKTSIFLFFCFFVMSSTLCFANDLSLKSTMKETVKNLNAVNRHEMPANSNELCNQSKKVSTSENLVIPVSISLGPDTKYSDADITEAIKDAQACWNTALQKSNRKDLHVVIDVKKLIHLEDDSTVIGNIHAPPLDELGNPLPQLARGFQASEYSIVISNKIERSNVKPYWDKSIPLELRKKAVLVGKLSAECDRIFKEELDPLQRQNFIAGSEEEKQREQKWSVISQKYNDSCNEYHKEENDLHSKLADLPMGNLVYISPRRDGASKSELAKTIAHELGHAWGGLADRYGGSPEIREKTKTNLMGLSAECNLEKAQVDYVKAYRETGKEEVF